MKYRKKPVEIEAKQLTDSDSYNEILVWCKDAAGFTEVKNCSAENPEGFDYPCIHIETSEGTMVASLGDYIIKEPFDKVRGFYPCKPDVFKMTYEKI